jgi:hypothetical protein
MHKLVITRKPENPALTYRYIDPLRLRLEESNGWILQMEAKRGLKMPLSIIGLDQIWPSRLDSIYGVYCK